MRAATLVGDVVVVRAATLVGVVNVGVVNVEGDDVLEVRRIVGSGVCSIGLLELVGVSTDSCCTIDEDEELELAGVVLLDTSGVTVTVRGASVTVFGFVDLVMAIVSYWISAEAAEEAGPPTSTTWYVAAGCGLGKALAPRTR